MINPDKELKRNTSLLLYKEELIDLVGYDSPLIKRFNALVDSNKAPIVITRLIGGTETFKELLNIAYEKVSKQKQMEFRSKLIKIAADKIINNLDCLGKYYPVMHETIRELVEYPSMGQLEEFYQVAICLPPKSKGKYDTVYYAEDERYPRGVRHLVEALHHYCEAYHHTDYFMVMRSTNLSVHWVNMISTPFRYIDPDYCQSIEDEVRELLFELFTEETTKDENN